MPVQRGRRKGASGVYVKNGESCKLARPEGLEPPPAQIRRILTERRFTG